MPPDAVLPLEELGVHAYNPGFQPALEPLKEEEAEGGHRALAVVDPASRQRQEAAREEVARVRDRLNAVRTAPPPHLTLVWRCQASGLGGTRIPCLRSLPHFVFNTRC